MRCAATARPYFPTDCPSFVTWRCWRYSGWRRSFWEACSSGTPRKALRTCCEPRVLCVLLRVSAPLRYSRSLRARTGCGLTAEEQRRGGGRREPSMVVFDGVSKSYPIYESPGDRLRELLLLNRRSLHRDFWALREVSFEVERGSTFCIIGENGSGKSTMLQLVAGIFPPTEGK